jgi:hypothetical protein
MQLFGVAFSTFCGEKRIWIFLKILYKLEMKFWAVLGSQGCREQKTPNCHKYATF